MNYLVPESDLTVDDTTNTLKDYHDTETGSGTPLKVGDHGVPGLEVVFCMVADKNIYLPNCSADFARTAAGMLPRLNVVQINRLDVR